MPLLEQLLSGLLGGSDAGRSATQSGPRQRQHPLNVRADTSDPALVRALHSVCERLALHAQKEEYREAGKRKRELWTIAGLFTAASLAGLQWLVFRQQASDFRDQENRQLRAYVAPSLPVVTCCNKDNPKRDIIKVPFDNDGQTPAYFLAGVLRKFQYTIDETFPNDFGCMTSNTLYQNDRHIAVVNPKKGYASIFEIDDDTRQQIVEARNGGYWMVFCGDLIYKDTFNAEYAQQFCFKFRYPDTLPDEMSVCPAYNQEVTSDYIAEAQKAREPRPPIYIPDVPQHQF